MRILKNREDLSRFLVHLTRKYNGMSAPNNLISILKDKRIDARNAHCLFMHKLNEMQFSDILKNKFRTVCFTETPLPQINKLISDKKGGKIELKPYGLVFWKEELFDKGSSPSIYINAKGTSISEYLLEQFDNIFQNIETFRELKKVEKEQYENIVHYYSLINVVKDKHDFLWEREWRHHGNFSFKYEDIVAIIANNPDGFDKMLKDKLSSQRYKFIKKLPIINPSWSYEEVIEKMAIKIWEKLS